MSACLFSERRAPGSGGGGTAGAPAARAWCFLTLVSLGLQTAATPRSPSGDLAQSEPFLGQPQALVREHDETFPRPRARPQPRLSADTSGHSAWPCTGPAPCAFPLLCAVSRLSCHKAPAGSDVSARDCREVCQSQAFQCFLQNKRGDERSGRSFLFGWFVCFDVVKNTEM